ncbi:hypothetical protein, partial [Metallosphaera sp.]|uniref:hypothetical protein n=1 Tax=Metallosphaera sp. TaxID=2020860 RepID=UPI00316BB88B
MSEQDTLKMGEAVKQATAKGVGKVPQHVWIPIAIMGKIAELSTKLGVAYNTTITALVISALDNVPIATRNVEKRVVVEKRII